MSATNFCESSSFMVKNAVKVLCVFDNKHVQFLCLCCHKNKTNMTVLSISCNSPCSGDAEETSNLVKYGQIWS